jgi:hypothetical protein
MTFAVVRGGHVVTVELAAYLLIGGMLGFLWNRAELGRAPLRRILPSFAAFLVAWPALALGMIAIAGFWTRVWRKAHADEHPPAPDRHAPAAPSFAEGPKPHPL